MSYEDLEEARAKRVAKEKATAAKGKGKRGRKRKSPALDTKVEVEAEANSQEEEAGSSVPKNKMARSRAGRSAMEDPSGENVLEQCCCFKGDLTLGVAQSIWETVTIKQMLLRDVS
jgi:hypothetical protein